MKLLRWVGGKDNANHIPHLLPDTYNTYYEPFCGGASIFFKVMPIKAVLGDFNANLVNTYQMVKECPDIVHAYLRRMNQDESSYYEYRERYNAGIESDIERAAVFIYLNKTGHRGNFRVNKDGGFNVPYGHVSITKLPDIQTMNAASWVLNNAILRSGDYKETCKDIRPRDFIFLDPPYHGTYDQYTVNGFDDNSHIELRKWLGELEGVYWLQTNSDTEFLRDLYSGYYIDGVNILQQIDDKQRYKREIIITNYRTKMTTDYKK